MARRADRWRKFGCLIGAALLLSACQSPASPGNELADQQAQSVADQLAVFETDPTQSSTFTDGLPSFFTDGLPSFFNLLDLPLFRLQATADSTPPYPGPFPSPASSPDPGTAVVYGPKATSYPGGGSKTVTGYQGGSVLVDLQRNGTTIEETLTGPAATASLPAGFSSWLSPIPASSSVAQRPTTYFTYNRTGHGVGYHWYVYDDSASPRHLVSWVRSLQVTYPQRGLTLIQSDAASDYQATAYGQFATHHLVDSLNQTGQTRYFMDARFDLASGTWTGNGYFQNLATGFQADIQQSWSPTTYAKTKTISFVTAQNLTVTLSEHFNADRSGDGSAYVGNTKIINLAWGQDGDGTMTLLRQGKTRPFRAF